MESSLHLGPVLKPTLALTALFCCPSPWTLGLEGFASGKSTGISTSPSQLPRRPGPVTNYQSPLKTLPPSPGGSTPAIEDTTTVHTSSSPPPLR